jgi:hypothetical protein
MGTVFNQPKRDSFTISKKDVDFFLDNALELAKKYKIELSNVISAYKVLELKRKNDLSHRNGDIFDEQVAGIAEILQALSEKN